MNVDSFFDTNILVYAALGSGRDERKRVRALDLIDTSHFGTSAQVLQEFYVTVVRKAARPLTPEEALEWIEQWIAFPCQPVDQFRNSRKFEGQTGLSPSARRDRG
jgi:predicted nucleic acid-binding protein